MKRKVKGKKLKKQFKYYFEPTGDYDWDCAINDFCIDLNKAVWSMGYSHI